MKELENYITNWIKTEGVKPCNEDEFIEPFLKFLQDETIDFELSFDGEGAYFGKQIKIEHNEVWSRSILFFEVAYNSEKISIYSGNHNGYWNPEYVCVTKEHLKFEVIRDALYEFIYKTMCLDSLISNN